MAILNLFRPERPAIGIEEIERALQVSPASAYRYASELTHAGLLSRIAGRYRPGPKIIELEYLSRFHDPIVRAAQDLMESLAGMTECDALLCNVYDDTVVNVYHVRSERQLDITYTRGRRMPLFRGAQSHIILAYMDRRKLKRIFEAALTDPDTGQDARAIGHDWKTFSHALKQIRTAGYYISRSQLDENVTGIAAPVFGENDEIVGSLVLTHYNRVAPKISEENLVGLVTQCANEISRRIGALPRGNEVA